eukprot:2746317-Amphidinium_carterae.1
MLGWTHGPGRYPPNDGIGSHEELPCRLGGSMEAVTDCSDTHLVCMHSDTLKRSAHMSNFVTQAPKAGLNMWFRIGVVGCGMGSRLLA